MELTQSDIDRVVDAALAEDVGSGDLTTDAVVPVEVRCRERHPRTAGLDKLIRNHGPVFYEPPHRHASRFASYSHG